MSIHGSWGLGRTQQRILTVLADGVPRTCRDIADRIDVPAASVTGKVFFMYAHGQSVALVQPTGKHGRHGARLWTITDLGRSRIEA